MEVNFHGFLALEAENGALHTSGWRSKLVRSARCVLHVV